MSKIFPLSLYQELVQQIRQTFLQGQEKAVIAVNTHLVQTYWSIGQYIVEYEQGGDPTASYGKQLLLQLSKDLSQELGKGFSRSNLQRMRQFYIEYPNCATVSHNLGWSHYVELLKIEDPLERSFYEKQSEIEKWSVRELQTSKESLPLSPSGGL